MSRASLTVVKFPRDILDNLKKEYPGMTNPSIIKIVYKNHQDLKVLQNRVINPAGRFIWGKKAWRSRFEKA
jgi:hypothetical protein